MNNTEWTPGSLMETSGAYWQTCALHAGVQLDIFTALDKGALTGKELALTLNYDQRGLVLLLNALSAMGLLIKDGNTYANSSGADLFLSRSSDKYMGYIISHHHHLAHSWINLDQAVEKGGPLSRSSEVSEEEGRESFLMGMFNIGMGIAPALSKELGLKGCSRLLDLGGGPGTYAIHFCMNNPGMEAVVCDLPTTRAFAEKTIDRFHMGNRVWFSPGDYTRDNFCLAPEFDAVWLSHILHGEGPQMAQKIVSRAVAALKPGGRILIHEFILDNTMDNPVFPALFSLNMFLRTKNGRSYSEKQLILMLEACGIKEIERLDFKGPTESGILAGRLG